jgi:integrase
MSFSCKIVLGDYEKQDEMRMVYLQAYIDRKRATVPLKFYLQEKYFDARGQCVRSSHPNHDSFNKELLVAITKGNTIASNFRLENKMLTPGLFRNEFINPSGELDLIKFMRRTLELRRPTIAFNTYKQHTTVINKLVGFSKTKKRTLIRFGDITVELIQEFKNHLIKEGNGPSTFNKILKILKQYLGEARTQDIKVADPFKIVKIKSFRSNRTSLSQAELNRLVKYFEKSDCPRSHKKLLRYFIFSCFTGLRISDIGVITWNNIHDDVLIFIPTKTKNNNRFTRVPLLERDKKLLPEYKPNQPIFETFSFPVSNRYLKDIAAIEEVDIKKKITYHTSRHTFGSLFAEGGNIQALQEMMGHGSITTTMGYVHSSTKSLVDAKKKRFAED